MYRLYFLLATFVAFSPVVLSQETVEYSTVVVEASETNSDEIEPQYLSSHVSVITRKEFDAKVATVADVMKSESGVQIRQIGGLGSFSTVNIRGSDSKQVNVYLNGVLVNGAFGGVVDLSQFSLENVEKIEVYRGSSPVSVGVAGIGGAINIRTRDFAKESQRTLKLGLGSLGTENVAYSLSDKIKGSDVLLSVEYLAAENNFSMLNNGLTPSYTGDDFIDRRNNADFDQFTGLFSLRKRINNSTVFSWVSQFFDKEDHFPDVFNSETNYSKLDSSFLSSHAKWDHALSHETNLTAEISYSIKNEHYLDTGNNVGVGINNEENLTENYQLGLRSSYVYGSHLLNAGLDTTLEQYTKHDYIDVNTFRYQRIRNVFGLQDEWLSNDGKWQISLGGRYFYIIDKSRLIGTDDARRYSSANFGILYAYSNRLHFHTNVSRNSRIPQLFELYGDRGLFNGNNELKPERAINADFGVRLKVGSFESKSSIFYRTLKDGIFISYGSSGTGQAINISQSQIVGVEADNKYDFNEFFSAALMTTFQDSQEISESTDRDGNSLLGLYRLSNTVSVSVADKQMVYSLEYRHQSGGFFDRSNDAPIPKQNQVNFNARWDFKPMSLEVRVDNIANNKFLDFNRYPIPGRRFFITAKTNF